MPTHDHPAGHRQVTMFLFRERIMVTPYLPCADLFQGLEFPPDPELVPASIEENYYQFYFAVAAALQPSSYLEIGTRFGYSTVAVSRGAPGLKRIVSCDLESYWNPSDMPSQQIAERNLRASGYCGEALFIADDSRRLLQHVENQSFDLVLVDGDHTYEGCRSDMTNGYQLLAPNGVMMIDDADQLAVFSAVTEWLREMKISGCDTCFLPTKHGLFLLRRPATGLPK